MAWVGAARLCRGHVALWRRVSLPTRSVQQVLRGPCTGKEPRATSATTNTSGVRCFRADWRHLPLPDEDGCRTFHAGDVLMESCVVMKDVRVRYEVHGTPNADMTNLVLHPTAFGATHRSLRYRIGPGPSFTLDTDKYCVVTVNTLGNGQSTSPPALGDYVGSAPPGVHARHATTVGDNVVLQARLLREEFGLPVSTPLALAFGFSMGAQQALHFACRFPSRVRRVAAVCGVARTTEYNRVFLATLRHALCGDPSWNDAAQAFTSFPHRGMRVFAAVYAGWALSPEFYRDQLYRRGDVQTMEQFIEAIAAGFSAMDPHALLALLHTWDTADPVRTVGDGTLADALGAVRAKVLMLPSETDRYFPPCDAEAEAALMHDAEVVTIPSVWGHRAGDPFRPGQEADNEFITQQVSRLLHDQDHDGT